MSIADLRKEYKLASLNESDVEADPLQQFRKWFSQAAEMRGSTSRLRSFGIHLYKAFQALAGEKPADPNAMALATADKDGRPSVRTVLLKGVDSKGFVFFTNYESRKGREFAENPNAALVIHWAELERQVCVSGSVSKLSREESEAYFNTRPRGSRLATWVSRQSKAVPNREFLEAGMAEVTAKYPEKVPMPEYWGGYVLEPVRIEFWQGRPSRLHDRLCYVRETDGKWRLERLAP